MDGSSFGMEAKTMDAVALLGQVIISKRAEQAARAAFGHSLMGPSAIIPVHAALWQASRTAVDVAKKYVKRAAPAKVIQFIPRRSH